MNHKDLVRIIEKLEREQNYSPKVIADKIYEFLHKFSMLGLLPKAEKILRAKTLEYKRRNTLIIKTSNEKELNLDTIKNIKDKLGVLPDDEVLILKIDSSNTGFIASYRGRVFDCRVSTNADILLKKLRQPI